MIRLLPALLEIGLLVYCLIDCIQSDSERVRNLPKLVWVLLIVLLPLVGGIAWLVAGRPARSTPGRTSWPSTRTSGFPEQGRPGRAPLGPDDDPDFLRQLRDVDDEHERTLKQWEDDLRRREQHLRDDDDGGTGGAPDDGTGTPPPDDPPAGGAPR
jgi:hypothetical protein